MKKKARILIKKCNLFHAEKFSLLSTGNSLILLFYFSLFLRFFVRLMDPCISRDGCLYIQLAQIWAESENGYLETLDYNFVGSPPLLIFIMASLIHCGISAKDSGIALNIIAGAFCPCLIYGISKEILKGNKKIALSAAILTSVNPSMISLSIEPQRDMLYLFFCACLCLLILKALHRTNLYCWCPAGIIFTLSFFTRYETFEFLFVILFALIVFSVKKKISLKKAFVYGTVFLASSIIAGGALLYLIGYPDSVWNQYKLFIKGKVEHYLGND